MVLKVAKEYRISRFLKPKDTVTLLNALFGFISIIYLIERNFLYASLFMMLAVLADAADGWVARKLSTPTEYGKFLDAADLISFGVAPALFLIVWLGNLTTNSGMFIYMASFLLIMCGLIRLARFFKLKVNAKIGVPITFNGLLIPILYFLNLNAWVVGIIISIECYLMISAIRWQLPSRHL